MPRHSGIAGGFEFLPARVAARLRRLNPRCTQRHHRAIATPLGRAAWESCASRARGPRVSKSWCASARFPPGKAGARNWPNCPTGGHAVDQVVITLPAPRSYTRNVVEIGCHGSPVVLRYCLERACQMGAALAEPANSRCERSERRLDLPGPSRARPDRARRCTGARGGAAGGGAVSRRIARSRSTARVDCAAGADRFATTPGLRLTEEILRRLAPVGRRRAAGGASLRPTGARRLTLAIVAALTSAKQPV